MPPIPPLTMKLLWALAAMLILPLLLPQGLLVQMAMWPLGDWVFGIEEGRALPSFMPWQLVTHAFITPASSLIFIGLTLYFFGGSLEAVWGERRYGLFLLAVLIGGAIVQLLVLTLCVRAGWVPFRPVTGANAVMFGILFACAWLDPHRRVMLLIPPVPMKMWVLVAVFSGLILLFDVFGQPGGIVNIGFLGGMLAAWLHIRYWRGQPPFRPRGPKPPNLRSVN